jgi:hypothetical protein
LLKIMVGICFLNLLRGVGLNLASGCRSGEYALLDVPTT